MRPRSERGVALISIMVIVVIATVLAVQMTNEQRLIIQRTANRFDASQARQYALGGEELARQILHRDLMEEGGVDHHGETWASPDLQFEFENGVVELRIEDLQGRFNINALHASSSETDAEGRRSSGGEANGVTDNEAEDGNEPAVGHTTLARLMEVVGVDSMYGARIIDWVDADDGKGQLGAEDFDYLALEPPYRSADRPVMDISELRLILEMDAETMAKLTPHVSALPNPAAALNVNTATAPVLAALVPNLTAEAAEGLVGTRNGGEPWESVTQFLQEPVLAGSGLSATGLGVQSSYFRVSVRARYLDRFAYLTSIVQRNPVDGSMRVYYRDMSKKIRPAARSESGDG